MAILKRHLSLVIAIGFATLSSLTIYHFLESRESVSIAKPVGLQSVEMIPVVIAKSNMPVGHKITDEDLNIQKWPKEAVTNIHFQSKSQTVGKILRFTVIAGEPLISSKILIDGENIAALIPENKSAVTIQIPRTTGLSSMLEEGSLVDVVATYDNDPSTSNPKVITRAAYVMAINQTGREKNKDSQSPIEVTLLVDSRYAPMIIHAMNQGEIELVLSGKHSPVLEVT